MANAIVSVPGRVKRGEVFEVKALVRHTMETGFRRTQLGARIPRDIITRFVCRYNGVEIVRMELHPAIAANPLLVFTAVATESGTLEFTWTGDNAFALTERAAIEVR